MKINKKRIINLLIIYEKLTYMMINNDQIILNFLSAGQHQVRLV